jgi:hypothetical protein
MLGKATFFMLEARHINGTRVITTACNSYPYYQDKKKLVFNSFQNPKIITTYFSFYQEKIKLKQKQLNLIKNLK